MLGNLAQRGFRPLLRERQLNQCQMSVDGAQTGIKHELAYFALTTVTRACPDSMLPPLEGVRRAPRMMCSPFALTDQRAG